MSRKVYFAARSLILTVASILGAVSILAFAAGLIFQVRPLIVISGSMEPTIQTGALLFSAQRAIGDIAVGDIVTADRPNGRGLVTHRVTEITEKDGVAALRLKGDANKIPDPQLYAQEKVGVHLFSVPGLGHVAGYFQTLGGLLIAAAAVLALVVLYFFEPPRRKARADAEATERPAPTPDDAGSPRRTRAAELQRAATESSERVHSIRRVHSAGRVRSARRHHRSARRRHSATRRRPTENGES